MSSYPVEIMFNQLSYLQVPSRVRYPKNIFQYPTQIVHKINSIFYIIFTRLSQVFTEALV